MKRHWLTIGTMAAALALSLTPLAAAGQRTNNTGSSSGTATPRGGDSGSSGSGSSAPAPSAPSGSASSGGSSSGGSSSGGSSSWDAPSGSRSSPERGGDRGGRSGDHAVPRNSPASSRSGSASSAASGSGEEAAGRAAVPSYSRPRDGRAPVGTAAERPGGALPPNTSLNVLYDPYFYYGSAGYYPYNPYYQYGYGYSPYWLPGYGFGLGYFSYDPFFYGSSYGGGYGGGSYGGYSNSSGNRTGSLRLKVKPNNAQVYIDGYFVGVVDSFDGVFQRLALDGGAHQIEIRADGYQSAQFDVMIAPGETATYKGELKRQ